MTSDAAVDDTVRILWNKYGPPLRDTGSQPDYSLVPGIRPNMSQGLSIYRDFIHRFRDTSVPGWREFIPTSAFLSSECCVVESVAIDCLGSRTGTAIVIHEGFPVDIHVDISTAHAVKYANGMTDMDRMVDTYFLTKDLSHLVAMSHEEIWYVQESLTEDRLIKA